MSIQLERGDPEWLRNNLKCGTQEYLRHMDEYELALAHKDEIDQDAIAESRKGLCLLCIEAGRDPMETLKIAYQHVLRGYPGENMKRLGVGL